MICGFNDWLRVRLRLIYYAIIEFPWTIYTIVVGKGEYPSVRKAITKEPTSIDVYWAEHTVNAPRFHTAHQSQKYLEWRFHAHPLFRELSGLYGDHENQTVVDYGCGPGNDVTGFAIHSRAAKVIGIDISARALTLTSRRLALHKIDPARIELIQISDSTSQIPLDDSAVDFVNCQGVFNHTSFPEGILREFYRILNSKGAACIMVYNRDSIWYNLFTAYEKKVIEGRFTNMSLDEAFSRSTDGENCPISRCFSPQQFTDTCTILGFKCKYMGGHFTPEEIECQKRFLSDAVHDERLAEEQRKFLAALQFDKQGLPLADGKYAGVGGVFHLTK